MEMPLSDAAGKASIETRLSLSRSCNEQYQESRGGGHDSLGCSDRCISHIGRCYQQSNKHRQSGALQGGQQTQFVGQTFNAPITGALTDFQFTLNSSTITSLYGAVYAWDGSKPTTLLWQSPVISGIGPGQNGAGLFDFSPTGANVTQGLTYVAFLST